MELELDPMSSKWSKKIVMYTDGASRGNPGPAAIGVVLQTPTGKKIDEISENIGVQTNNYAEYFAVISGLKLALENKVSQIHVISDSEFLIKQLKGEYKVKSENIIPLYREAKDLLGEFKSVKLEHILREKNKEADKLANKALDSGKPSILGNKKIETAPVDLAGVEISDLTDEDFDGYRTVLGEVAREKKYLCFVDAPTKEASEKFLSHLRQTNGIILVARTEGQVVGWCDIHRGSAPRFDHTGSLGMGVSKDFRGKGIGEALMRKALQLAREKKMEIVTLSVFSSNRAAIKMYEKIGFEIDGVRKDFSKLEGRYEDITLMSIRI